MTNTEDKKIIILHASTSFAARQLVAEMVAQMTVDQVDIVVRDSLYELKNSNPFKELDPIPQLGFLKRENDRPYLKRKKGRS